MCFWEGYAIVVSASFVPLIFFAVSLASDAVTYAALRDVSSVNLFLFPAMGFFVHYYLVSLIIRGVKDWSRRKAAVVALPIIVPGVLIVVACLYALILLGGFESELLRELT